SSSSARSSRSIPRGRPTQPRRAPPSASSAAAPRPSAHPSATSPPSSARVRATRRSPATPSTAWSPARARSASDSEADSKSSRRRLPRHRVAAHREGPGGLDRHGGAGAPDDRQRNAEREREPAADHEAHAHAELRPVRGADEARNGLRILLALREALVFGAA